LKRDFYCLTRSMNSFDEFSSALCSTLYMAMVCSQAPQQATKFSFSMLKIILSSLLGASEIDACNPVREKLLGLSSGPEVA